MSALRAIVAFAVAAAGGAGAGARTEVEAPAPPDPGLAPERLVLHTPAGDVVVALYAGAAPRHAAQILGLARLGAYDSVRFIRVDPQGYYVQVGDVHEREVPSTPAQRAANRPLAAEFSALRHVRGAVSMARHPADPDSARSSLVFVLRDSPHLDPPAARYTVVGRVERGLDVLDSFGRYLAPGSDAPNVPLLIQKANVVTEGELLQMALRPVRPVERPAAALAPPGRGERLLRAAAVGFVALAAVLGAAFVAARRAGAGRWTTSLLLLGLLLCAFLLLVLLVPAAWGRAWLGAALIAAGVGAIRLMTYFDAER